MTHILATAGSEKLHSSWFESTERVLHMQQTIAEGLSFPKTIPRDTQLVSEIFSFAAFSLEGSGISFADLFRLIAFYCISR